MFTIWPNLSTPEPGRNRATAAPSLNGFSGLVFFFIAVHFADKKVWSRSEGKSYMTLPPYNKSKIWVSLDRRQIALTICTQLTDFKQHKT